MSEYIDGLMQGSHKLTKNQIHAWAKASRNRVKEGKEAEALRKARTKTNHKFKPILEAL